MLFQVKKKNNKVWIPDRCPWAANKSSRWPDFWFKGKLFFHAFKYRWSHIRKTLKDSNGGLRNRILSYTSRKCGGSVSDTPGQWCTPKVTNVDIIQSPQSRFTPRYLLSSHFLRHRPPESRILLSPICQQTKFHSTERSRTKQENVGSTLRC